MSNVPVTYQGKQLILFVLGIFWTMCLVRMVFVIPWLIQEKRQLAQKSAIAATDEDLRAATGTNTTSNSSQTQNCNESREQKVTA